MTIDHNEKTTPVVPDAAPHETSIAVWDIPAPIIVGRSVRIKVGVRCTGGCSLTNQEIEIFDAGLNRMAIARLGPAPLPGTIGLYWTEANIVAPLGDGTHVFTARFSSSDLEFPHLSSSLPFSLMTVKQPEHRVAVEVFEQNKNIPIANSEVRLGAFRTLTNANGVALLDVPHGTYELNAWKMGYEFTTRNLDVNGDVSVRVELTVEPEPSPYGEG